MDIRPAGETSRMVTDTYDITAGELFEVKASASRNHIRAAVAQLLDYRRHVSDLRRATVVVPATPSADLKEYISTAGLALAVFHEVSCADLIDNPGRPTDQRRRRGPIHEPKLEHQVTVCRNA